MVLVIATRTEMYTKSQQGTSQGVLSQEYNSQCPQSVKTKHDKHIAAFLKVNHHLNNKKVSVFQYIDDRLSRFLVIRNALDPGGSG